MRGLQLRAALVGDLDKEIREAKARVANASMAAMHEFSRDWVGKLRQDILQSGLANASRLSTTWRTQVYPKGRASMGPAATFFSNAALIVEAFENGHEVKSPNGTWLAIPNPEAFPTRIRRRRNGPSPISIAEARFGPLRMVFLKGRRNLALLVTDVRRGRGKRGGFRKLTDAARKRGDYEAQVIFYLVPRAKLPRLLKGETIRRRLEAGFPAEYQRRFDAALARANSGPALLTDGD